MPAFADDNLPLSGVGGPVLSGGMQYKAASGGLPNRVTTQDKFKINYPDGVNDYGGVMFDPNGGFFWIHSWNSGVSNPKQYSLATGLPTGVTAASAFGMGMWPHDTSVWYLADYSGSQIVELNWAGSVLRTCPCGFNPMNVCRVPGVANKVWAVQYPGGVLTEFNMSTGLATGRTIGTAAVFSFGTPGFLWYSDAVTIYKYAESTLTLVDQWTPLGDTSSDVGAYYPGYAQTFFVDSSNRPILMNGLHWNVDRFSATGSAVNPATFDRRMIYAQPQLFGSSVFKPGGPCVTFFGNYAAYTSIDPSNLGNGLSVVVMNLLGTQRARWTKTFVGSTTLRRITVPGDLCNDRGPTFDLRKTSLYYSINGGARVNFTSGDDLAVPIVGGDVLTFDVDIVEGNGQATNAPFIGGTNGEGPHVIYDTSGTAPSTPVVSNVIPAPGTPIAANTPLQFDVTEVTPGLAYVYVWVLFQNSIDRLLIFNGHTFQGSFAQGSTITPIANGYRFVVNKFPFWPTAITELFVEAVDIGGGGG